MSLTKSFIKLSIDFNSEYPEAAKQEIESIIYNSLIAHSKINRVNIDYSLVLPEELKSMTKSERTKFLESQLNN